MKKIKRIIIHSFIHIGARRILFQQKKKPENHFQSCLLPLMIMNWIEENYVMFFKRLPYNNGCLYMDDWWSSHGMRKLSSTKKEKKKEYPIWLPLSSLPSAIIDDDDDNNKLFFFIRPEDYFIFFLGARFFYLWQRNNQ